ncbi:MAG: hypothetical protein OEU54_13580 [Gemmatimonadota bacterium]|nr:hypothetical protein [Gemmatimonadota bacterium]
MTEYLVIGTAAFALGYLVRGRWARRRVAASQARWQERVDTLQGQLGLKRVRIQELEGEAARSDRVTVRADSSRTS